MQRAAAEAAWIGKLPLLESAVGVKQFGALGPQCGYLSAHRVDVTVRGAANLDRDVAGAVVGDRAAASRQRFGDPAGHLGTARVGDGVDLLVRPALLHDGRDAYPAVVLHRSQGAVDLLVGGRPEVADGPVEPAGQLVTRAGLFTQRHEDRVGKCHAGQHMAIPPRYATCCSATKRIVGGFVRSAGQHQFTLTSVPWWLTCTEQSAMAGLANPRDITANVPAVASPRAIFFISTPKIGLSCAKRLLFRRTAPSRRIFPRARDFARFASDHSLGAYVAGVTHAGSRGKAGSDGSVPSRLVCATSSISNHAQPLTGRRRS